MCWWIDFQKQKPEFRYAQQGGFGYRLRGAVEFGGKKIRYPRLLGEKVNKSLIGQRRT